MPQKPIDKLKFEQKKETNKKYMIDNNYLLLSHGHLYGLKVILGKHIPYF